MNLIKHCVLTLAVATLTGCGQTRKATIDTAVATPVGPAFMADSAYLFCERQCAFGPRTMNSTAHDQCGEWIQQTFASYGMSVTTQQTTLRGYDGTALRCTNIMASYKPELNNRVLLCAHWDSRPWADNDPDEANHHTPVLAANDGASGVAVMLEVARLLSQTDSLALGVDFVCFDAEDWGTPQWSDLADDADSWALGAQHWAANVDAVYTAANKPRYGILLDMVGGRGAHLYQELGSLQYARDVVDKVWSAADVVGFASFFPKSKGGMITDDHVPVNQVAGIPCIDIIPFHPDCAASSFGPTWHTVNDDMDHIDRHTLQAVGQTLIQVLFSE